MTPHWLDLKVLPVDPVEPVEVLAELLGYSPGKIEELRAEGAVS